ncbi:MAG: glycosyltransferase family 2 protein [Planctomycetes bacterium]|nr:glycosyltransferase family 2 protein [Planctomycetota bacterium]MBF0244174.1 glycosyltransferase family 2 protein [Planctomycetota bacterium]
MYREKKISLVIPCRNEERLIRPTLEEVPDYFDIVFAVDDGSDDGTARVIGELAEKDPRICLIRHPSNLGVGQSIIDGYRRSLEEGVDIAVVIGGDHQMPIEESPRLLDAVIDDGVDYAKGNRFMGDGSAFKIMPKTRFIGNTLLSLMTKVASGHYGVFDVVDGFTAISRQAMQRVDWDKAWKGYGYPMDFIIRIHSHGFQIADVPRTAIYTEGERQSQIKGFRYMLRVTPMIFRAFWHRLVTRYIYADFHPLVLMYMLGLILLPMGGFLGVWLVLDKIFLAGTAVTGSRSVMCALLLVSGLQLFTMAMAMDLQVYQDSLRRNKDER